MSLSAQDVRRAADAEQGGIPQQEYRNTHFLLFGHEPKEAEALRFNTAGARDYLKSHGYAKGGLSHLREQDGIADKYRGFHMPGEHVCDFCGKRLTGAEYEVLKDGRERCGECARTVLRGQAALSALFEETKRGMCTKYGIDFPVKISVHVTTAKEIAKHLGRDFTPTPGFDSRSVGFAQKAGNEYTIELENEIPRMSLLSTIVHELTHIWQYTHWPDSLREKYGEYYLALAEGHAVWSETQYLYLINEARRASDYAAGMMQRYDEYGYGFRAYIKQYPLSRGIVLEGNTPFMNLDAPLDPALLGSESGEA